ncbi:hypothetical protein G6M70_15015 [Agrobacterium tumefaciens]|uniref:hypothetical protein n=1 Tax=Agrobacterium tumefaciens TaxID=358 RepID=UPI00080FE480|nr:hypothetical protein [Agrobacterium tumefaciens]NSZ02364.1 hypothetical protein [Agrobacterium tumefaciens]NSZ37838.1 hypothetical protein [Agrobacterium tumefaciens]NTB02231.1 hypothetical protein [Agrobacterium tumefaciens]NTB25481.1 hypothetical protein [Agrobacterium tumefaciens]NTB30278.1 hypothetical protein [Agrobacterium tumefaciens]
MKLRGTRYVFGSSILFAHFATIFIYFIYGNRYLRGDIAEIMQGILTVAPVSALYLTAFLNYVTGYPRGAPDENDPATGRIGLPSFLVQYFVILVFCVALIGGPIYVFNTGAFKFENVKLITGSIDTLFAGYLGIIFKRLFPQPKES